jgi:hypothetical protein
MPNTRKNPRDPDSPFLTREFFKNAKPFKERSPHWDSSSVTVVEVDDEAQASPSNPSTKEKVPSASKRPRQKAA